MTSRQLQLAELRCAQTDRVRSLVERLCALLDGRATRSEVRAWARELWPPEAGQGSPFTSGTATAVFSALWNLDERHGGADVVRDSDLRVYLRWLREGDWCQRDEVPLIGLERDIDELAAQTGTEPFRWPLEGLGWLVSLPFCAPATVRPFIAHASLSRPSRLDIHKLRSDDPHAAIVDLFEALAIDDADVGHLDPRVDLSRLPTWALWRQDDNGNRFEMARFRSYAKACAQEQLFTARGHKQNYWVEEA